VGVGLGVHVDVGALVREYVCVCARGCVCGGPIVAPVSVSVSCLCVSVGVSE